MLTEKQKTQIISQAEEISQWGFGKLEIDWHDGEIKKMLLTRVELPVEK